MKREPNQTTTNNFLTTLIVLLLTLVFIEVGTLAQTPDFRLDCAVNWNDGKYYFFRGDKYIRFDIAKDRADAGYPLKITGNWSKLPTSDIDAAVKWNDELAYFFKGDKYFIYDMKKNEASEVGLPFALISPYLQQLQLKKVDAVVKWDNKAAYFISDDKVARLDLTTLAVSVMLPLNAFFPGLTFTKIDATLNKDNEFIYFFSGNQYTRFNIKKGSCDPGYPYGVGEWNGVTDEYWYAKTAYNDAKREFTTTFDYPRQVKSAEPVANQKVDKENFGDVTQQFSPVLVEQNTRQAYKAKPTFFRFNLVPVVVRRNNDVVVSLTDNTDFNNACFVQQPHWSGYFLDSINIKFTNLTAEGWASPAWGPKTANGSGGYGHESGFHVDASLGFDGKTPQGSVSGGWSQSKSTSATIFDIEFTANAPDGNPKFNWTIGQMYDGPTAPIAIVNNNWWDAIRKVAAQVDITRSVYEPPKLAQTNFQTVAYAFYHPSSTANFAKVAGKDMRILVEYDVAYRAVHTANQSKNGGDKLWRGFSLVFGANKDMYTGEAFRSWSTLVVRHKYQIEVVIPKEHLKPIAAN